MRLLKVSIDFDSTLTKPCVQEFVKQLNRKGIEVHITTSRYQTGIHTNAGLQITYNNADVYRIAEQCDIDPWNIHFTNGNYKVEYLDKEFLFHLDDDRFEIERITHIPAIQVNESHSLHKCWNIIENEFKKRGLI